MKIIRKYIVSDSVVKSLIQENVFLIEKPEQNKSENYIVYKYKELSGGFIKDYSIEFNLIGKNINLLLQLKDRLIELLDDPRNNKIIKDNDTTIRTSSLVNGGGMLKNPETGNYHLVVFFTVKI